MGNSATPEETIQAIRAFLAEQRGFGVKVEQENKLNHARRARVVARFQDRLFDDVLERVGIDKARIEKQQQKDSAAMREFSEKQKVLIGKQATVRAKRHNERIRQIQRQGRMFERENGNPTTLVCCWFADQIDAAVGVEINIGDTQFVQTGPETSVGDAGQNIVEYGARVTAGRDGTRVLARFFDFHFVWNCDHTGLLRATSWIHPNCSYEVLAEPVCSGKPFAQVEIVAEMLIGQYTPGGETNIYPSGDGHEILNKSVVGGSSVGTGYIGSSGTSPTFNDEITISNIYQIPVVSGFPVVTTVIIGTSVEAMDRAEAELDLSSGAFQLAVPSVWLVVE